MRVWIARVAMLVGLGLLGWVLLFFLAPHGLDWIVWALGIAIAAFLALELVLRARRRGADTSDWTRWQAAQTDPSARRKAIFELRSRIDRARRFGARRALEHARLASVLAELLEADDRADQAIAVLAKVPIDALDPLQATVVRQARAQAYLAAGDTDGAEATLAAAPPRTGEDILDASLSLSRAWVALARGRNDDAEAAAHAIAAAADEGDELHDEARALLAMVHASGGDPQATRAHLARIDEEGRRRLALLGPAALRPHLTDP